MLFPHKAVLSFVPENQINFQIFGELVDGNILAIQAHVGKQI